MSKKNHNVYFNLHTVSGIVISFGLYIIFFAGAFTLFYGPIIKWEEGTFVEETNYVKKHNVIIDYNRLMDSLSVKGFDLYARDISTREKGEIFQNITIRASKDSLASKDAKKRLKLKFNTTTYEIKEYKNGYSLAKLLDHLHYYYQLGKPGYYLSGVVALFFLFAIITGVIVQWKKIVSNFYVFRPLEKLKTVWTDAHTALGFIGIPFQFLYALTGAMFGLGIVVTLSASILYGGDKDKYYDVVRGEKKVAPKLIPTDVSTYNYNAYRDRVNTHWDGFKGKYFYILNYGTSAQQFKSYVQVDAKTKFINEGQIIFDMASGAIVKEKNPFEEILPAEIKSTVYSLHYAHYGGLSTWSNYWLKILYFIMAIITCFVIITGVLIWLVARNKKNIPEKKRRFNEKVGHVYLAISLSMLPITAFSFIVSKLIPSSFSEHRKLILYWIFFGGWLLLSLYFTLKKNNYFTNKYTLLSGGILGLCIPLVNGFSSGNWIWRTFMNQNYDVFIVDVLWTGIAIVSLYTVFRLRKKTRNSYCQDDITRIKPSINDIKNT